VALLLALTTDFGFVPSPLLPTSLQLPLVLSTISSFQLETFKFR